MNRVGPLLTLKSFHRILVLHLTKAGGVALLAHQIITLLTPVHYLSIVDDSLTHHTGAVKEAANSRLTTRSSVVGVGVGG